MSTSPTSTRRIGGLWRPAPGPSRSRSIRRTAIAALWWRTGGATPGRSPPTRRLGRTRQSHGDAVPFLIGVALALATCVFASLVGLDRDRAFYPTVLWVIATYYVLFAVMGGSART